MFSVGYLVQRERDGLVAFCKALDYAAAFEAEEVEDELKRLADAFTFERDLLSHCESRRMSRIVRSLDSGRIRVHGAQPPTVSYLIFERADADSRDILDASDDTDAQTAVGLAHDCAVALAQLHRSLITHQDVKPANVLGWRAVSGKWSGKLADLGRAFSVSMASPYADLCCPGDADWAAPEILYALNDPRPRGFAERQFADLYSLGSLLCYLLTRVPYSGLLALNLSREHHWAKWQGGYEPARAFLADAHDLAIERLRSSVHSALADGLVPIVADLCDPDVEHRGRWLQGGRPRSSAVVLERCMSRLDLIQKTIDVMRGRGIEL